jgi:hypothetical protein
VGIADGTLFAMGHGISIIDATTAEIGYRHPTVRAGGQVTSAADHIVIYNHDGISGFE